MNSDLTTAQLYLKADFLRQDVINMLQLAGSGHPAGSLGLAEVVATLYLKIMRIRPQEPDWPERDIFMLSNGHVVPIQYATMAEAGFFRRSELSTLRRLGSRLQGHPERSKLPGIEMTSGPLGCGLSQAAGYAYSLQYLDKNQQRYVYVIMGDGELDEGNIWESAMFAGKYKLSQLIAFVDRNNIQIDGNTEDVMPLENLRAKWESFGWHVLEIDGHNIDSIIDAVSIAKAVVNRPTVILAHTIPGRGVDFMEHDYKWHGVAPNQEEANLAIKKIMTFRTPKKEAKNG